MNKLKVGKDETICMGEYSVAIGAGIKCNHNHCFLMGNNLTSKGDKHVQINVGGHDIINEIADNESLISLRDFMAKILPFMKSNMGIFIQLLIQIHFDQILQ